MRVAMLLPVIVTIGLWARSHGGHGEGQAPPALHWFVTAFAGLVVLNEPGADPRRGPRRRQHRVALMSCGRGDHPALGIKTHFRELPKSAGNRRVDGPQTLLIAALG